MHTTPDAIRFAATDRAARRTREASEARAVRALRAVRRPEGSRVRALLAAVTRPRAQRAPERAVRTTPSGAEA